MKYIWNVFIIIVLIPLSSLSQIVQKGIPEYYTPKSSDIPTIILPGIDYKKIKREEKRKEISRLKKMRYAEILEVDINPDYEGNWMKGKSGQNVWYLKIHSEGAYSLGLLFDHYRLPRGAKLYVYSADKSHVRGAFTYKNNKASYMLPVAPVKGDEIILEYHEPVDAAFKGELHIASVAHDYKDILSYLSKGEKGFGNSGDCNINVNCDNNELWQLLKHSVCKITYNGWLCSGSLINTTKQDETPYFLTANHCINNDYDASVANFYFNYESATCEDANGPLDQTVAGATLISTPPQETVDFSLLELSVQPPPAYKPYYAGWNRDITDPLQVISIHHPSGDIKKITKSYDGATTGDYGDGYDPHKHWWVEEWDEGTTEGGSSGSPLFNLKGQIIGDLTGGDASCSYNFNDYYQQLYHSWQDFENQDQQLKHWLDPLNSDVVEMDGFLPFDSVPSHLKAHVIDTIVSLDWNEVVDIDNIDFYYVYRNDIKIDSVGSSSYTDTLIESTGFYKYYITAKYHSPQELESLSSNLAYIRTYNSFSLPYAETFENSAIISDYWYEERTNDTVGWELKSGGAELIVDTAFEGSLNAYFYNDNAESSRFVLPKFDLSAYPNLKLSFYLHMQGLLNEVHKLNILYKSADTLEWKIIRSFQEDINTWRKKEIVLPDLTDTYQVAFEGVGLGGFGICIDSIAIKEDNNLIYPEFYVDADTICSSDSIQYTSIVDSSNQIYWDFGQTAHPEEAFGQGPHWVKYDTAGIKSVQLLVNDTYIKNDRQVVVVYDIPPKPVFANQGNQLISSAEYGNQWYFNEDPILGATDNTYEIMRDGSYYVEVTNSFGCKSISNSQFMMVNDVEDFKDIITDDESIRIYPNPNSGSFYVKLGRTGLQPYYYRILGMNGRVIGSGVLESDDKEQKIQLDHVTEGIYFIQIVGENSHTTTKLLIKK